MSSTQRGYSQLLTKSFSTGAAAKLYQVSDLVNNLDGATTYTVVSPTNYSVTAAADLTSAMAGLASDGVALSSNETLKDLGRTLTVTAADTGSTVRLAHVQRTNTVSGASGNTGFVVIHNDAAVAPPPVFRH